MGLAVVLLAVGLVAPPWVRGLSFVVRAAGLQGSVAGFVAGWGSVPVQTSELRIPTRHGDVRARLYLPERRSGRLVVLTSGVHSDGIDEPRLRKLAQDLAAGGHPVLTPEPPDLLHYEISPRIPDVITDVTLWVVERADLVPDGRVNLFGISFSGGMSVIAAGRPELYPHVAAVLSFGGHGDLSRVLNFLCTGVQSDGVRRAPHDYGVAVLLLNVVERLVPTEQLEPLRVGILTFLRASNLTLSDGKQAEATFTRARELQTEMREPAASLMGFVNQRNVASLGTSLLPFSRDLGETLGMSPERAPHPIAPVYLVHGSEDSVIPAIEASSLARSLAPGADVHLLITPLVTHAELDRAGGLKEAWRLVGFWSDLLSE
ncbi:dienelactone hydrolase family protein [Citreicoccus inhibens]|uniref:hypothetical protein n=1 Tax=Citreicoccus inhibens TaxID=2849499 RepID=UPI002E28ADC5|nr:hypothetical protein [Citreicoccus inhibens]